MLSQDELNKIRERAEKATKGPWRKVSPICHVVGEPQTHSVEGPPSDFMFIQNEADADLIAHARTDIPALLEHVAELERELAPFREAKDWWNKQLYGDTDSQSLARKEGV